MAPKMRLPKRKSTEEEARKKKKVSSTTSSSSPLGKTPLSTRNVALGRNVDFQFLEEEGFSIGSKIINQGWKSFCSLNQDTAVDLVREFYHNFQSSFNQISSIVKGTEIQISTSVLSRVLDIPLVPYFDDSNVDRKTKLELILNKEIPSPLEKLELKDLSVEMRVLHHIACKIICPRAGRFDYISEQDISIMYHILGEFPMNLPALIMDTMCDAIKRTKTVLPYGMMLTRIFQAYDIDLKDETLSPLLHTDTFNVHTFRRMGFLKVDQIWTTREQRALGALNEEGEEVRPPSPPPQEPSFQAHPSAPESMAAGPSVFQPPHYLQSNSVEVRLSEDQIQQIAVQVANILRGTQGQENRTNEQGIVPHSSQIARDLSEIKRKLDYVEYEIVKIRARVTEIENQVERISLPPGPTFDQIQEVSELSNEAARLRGVVLDGIKQMKDSSQSNFIIHNLQELKNSLDLLRAQIMSSPSAGTSRRRRRRRSDSSSDEDEE